MNASVDSCGRKSPAPQRSGATTEKPGKAIGGAPRPAAPDADELARYLRELDRRCVAGEPMTYREWELHQYDHQGCGH